MKCIAFFIAGAILIAGCAKGPDGSDQKSHSPHPSGKTKNIPAPPTNSDANAEEKLMEQFKALVVRKRDYAKRMVVEQNIKPPPLIWEFYQSAIDGDFAKTQKKFSELGKQYGRGENKAAVLSEVQHTFPPAMEVVGAMEMVDGWHAKFLHFYTTEIVSSIPEGSIYFGGTDPGRFAITMGSKSHEKADPFFTITQNALADGSYLQYLRELYGNKIYISTEEDRGRAFSNYYSEAKAKGGQSQGILAIMDINGRLAKVIFNKNPDHDFYLEESFPLEWMMPHMVPHGLIFKLERKPLKELMPEQLAKNRKDWQKYMALFVGDFVTTETTVSELCEWIQAVYSKNDLGKFTGDPLYLKGKQGKMKTHPLQQGPTYSEQKNFSKMRSAQAGLFRWRSLNTQDAQLKSLYAQEAEFAYAQSIALGGINPGGVLQFSIHLSAAKRFKDAKLLVRTFVSIQKNGSEFYIRQMLGNILKSEMDHWREEKEYDKAISAIEELKELLPENKTQLQLQIDQLRNLQ